MTVEDPGRELARMLGVPDDAPGTTFEFTPRRRSLADWLWSETKYVVHNVVAHPLLVLWPGVGEWLHDRTVG